VTTLPGDGPPGAGRRGNGLPAAEWGALVDLDPRLSEALLSSLAAEGVAAFVEPAAGVDTVSRAASLPKRPLDRLWVDPARAEQARVVVTAEVADLSALLAEDEPGATAHGLVRPVPRTAATRVLAPPQLPDPPRRDGAPPTSGAPAELPLDDDEAFRQIIAGFSTEVAPQVPPWPVAEDLPGAARARPAPEPGAPPYRRRTDPPRPDEGPAGTAPPGSPAPGVQPRDAPPPGVQSPRTQRPGTARPGVRSPGAQTPDDRGGGAQTSNRPPAEGLPGWVEPERIEDDGHFVPPPPPAVPRVRPRTVGAVVMLVLGLVLLFAPDLVGQVADTGILLLGIVLTAGGAGLLVWWVRDAPGNDSGPDHGAVV